ncbi:hypothetical protein EV368DRAFT_79334 [Lentinula lateritia]|uniref:Uncharacterized protein n=1 Tax=Lentinula aff. lateritia TaxID=2804960 RepID=A0ACC1TT03_9AGAR|nr:hypothetical protein F5876DRAFT_79551 [Lentinula aff. lateritia]KAJ3855786.1 hypothetical protein EV368DRAFT_79334 [Lentinula lateritia]
MNQRSEGTEYDPFTRKRYLRRQWKLFKPHLQRSDSLPDFSLIPNAHPLFTCKNCNFSNAIVDLCLWCPLASAEAETDDSDIQFRRRRVSAPAFMLCWQLPRPRPSNRTLRLTAPIATARTLHKSSDSSYPTNSEMKISVANDTSLSYSFGPPLPVEEYVNIDVSVLPRRDGIVASLGCGVVTATVRPEAQASFAASPLIPSREVDPGVSCYQTQSGGTSGEVGVHVEQSSSSNHSAAKFIRANPHVDMSPKPPLRRKKSHLILHMSTPPSQSKNTLTVPPGRQRPHSQPAVSFSTAFTSQSVLLPITDLNHHMRAQPRAQADLHQLQLGHPNRPYYTALRKNMSPPSMPLHFASPSPQSAVRPLSSPSLSLSRTSSLAFQPPYPASFSDDSHEFSIAEFSQFTQLGTTTSTPFRPFGVVPSSPFVHAPSRRSSSARSGFRLPSIKGKFRRNSETAFSKSDEMKIRLALARKVGGETGVGGDEGYVYRSGGMTNVKMHLRRLSRGLKDFVLLNQRS